MGQQSKPDIFFTEREEQVLNLQMQSLNNNEIARKLNISKATVNTYKMRIRQKIQMIERFHGKKDKKKRVYIKKHLRGLSNKTLFHP